MFFVTVYFFLLRLCLSTSQFFSRDFLLLFSFFDTVDFTLLDLSTRKKLNVTRICLRASEQPVTYTFMNLWERDKLEWGSLTSCHTTRLVRLRVLKHHAFNQKHKPFCSTAGLSRVPFSLLMFFFYSILWWGRSDRICGQGVTGSRSLCKSAALGFGLLKASISLSFDRLYPAYL